MLSPGFKPLSTVARHLFERGAARENSGERVADGAPGAQLRLATS